MNDSTPPLSAGSTEAERTPVEESSFLQGFWYYAAASTDIALGKTYGRVFLGQPILVGRNLTGDVFAIRDTCPHRGTLLSRGSFDGNEVECPYHGWRFNTQGQCTHIPSQFPNQSPQATDIKTSCYPSKESQGNIWVFMGDVPAELPPTPSVPDIGERFQLHLNRRFECNIDMAITGLMDPAHGAFIHTSRMWRSHRDVQAKEKQFSPTPLGWRMDKHTTSSNSRAYKLLLGGTPETEITYSLPGLRVEHATTGRFTYCGLTACTPVNSKTTDVHHVMYWDVPGSFVMRPLIRLIARQFLDQDANAVKHMRDGQAFNPNTMLIQDADTQIRWYYRLKQEWQLSQAQDRGFHNPIKPVTLRWRS